MVTVSRRFVAHRFAAPSVDLEREAAEGFLKSSLGKHIPVALDDVSDAGMKSVWAPREANVLPNSAVSRSVSKIATSSRGGKGSFVLAEDYPRSSLTQLIPMRSSPRGSPA